MTWIEQDEEGKTIYVVLTRTDVELTPHDRENLKPPAAIPEAPDPESGDTWRDHGGS